MSNPKRAAENRAIWSTLARAECKTVHRHGSLKGVNLNSEVHHICIQLAPARCL